MALFNRFRNLKKDKSSPETASPDTEDKIEGTDFHEVITGTDKNDIIVSKSGYDTLDGGEGSDTYLVGENDYNGRYIDGFNDSGKKGTDVIKAEKGGIEIGILSGFDSKSGIEVIDGIKGSSIMGDNDAQEWDFSKTKIRGVDAIRAEGGHDIVTGSKKGDTIYGGEGHDTLNGGRGKDKLFGENGHDTLNGGKGKDLLDGGAGHDVLNGGNGRDTLLGDSGNDILNGGKGKDTLSGGEGYDIFDGGQGGDTYLVGKDDYQGRYLDSYNDSGTKGRDSIRAEEEGTEIGIKSGFDSTSGIEVIDGIKGSSIMGDNDAQVWDFSGTKIKGISSIEAQDGHDTITGSRSGDTISGGDGHDTINGHNGNDTLFGDNGHDRLNGDKGKDTLSGGDGHDILDGGQGRDTLNGGTGNDILFGGRGNDVFIFAENSGNDTIKDFQDGADMIDLTILQNISSFDQLDITREGDNTVIHLEGEHHITLENIDAAVLDTDDFLLA